MQSLGLLSLEVVLLYLKHVNHSISHRLPYSHCHQTNFMSFPSPHYISLFFTHTLVFHSPLHHTVYNLFSCHPPFHTHRSPQYLLMWMMRWWGSYTSQRSSGIVTGIVCPCSTRDRWKTRSRSLFYFLLRMWVIVLAVIMCTSSVLYIFQATVLFHLCTRLMFLSYIQYWYLCLHSKLTSSLSCPWYPSYLYAELITSLSLYQVHFYLYTRLVYCPLYIKLISSLFTPNWPSYFIHILGRDYCQQCSDYYVELQRKLLAVYLHHDGSILSNVFCSQALCQVSVVDYLSANFIVWGWDLTHEANKARYGHECECGNCVPFVAYSYPWMIQRST